MIYLTGNNDLFQIIKNLGNFNFFWQAVPMIYHLKMVATSADELQAMFLVADRNLQMGHWAQGTAESLQRHWSVTPLPDPSTAPGFISKVAHAVAASQSGSQNFCVYLFVHRNV
jgi:hypothetical protein